MTDNGVKGKKTFELITAEGGRTTKKRMTFKELQDFCGGCIEKSGDFWVNEDGIPLDLPRNKTFPQFVGNIVREVIIGKDGLLD